MHFDPERFAGHKSCRVVSTKWNLSLSAWVCNIWGGPRLRPHQNRPNTWCSRKRN